MDILELRQAARAWFAAVVLGLSMSGAAVGQTPFFAIDELFSNADGSVQFVLMNNVDSNRLAGQTLVSSSGTLTHSYTFPGDLPGGAINRTFLVATQGFADLGLVTPDYVIPNGFLFVPVGSIRVGVNSASYDMPADGVRGLWFDGDGGPNGVANAVATNFAGRTYTFRGAIASDNSFRITQVYSNRDGSIQYIQLKESAGLNGQHHLAGRALRIDHWGTIREFVFPADLPSSATANETVLIATRAGIPYYGAICCAAAGDWNLLAPDFVMPDRFLSVECGTLDFAGIDYVPFHNLPTDGISAIDRDSRSLPARARSFQKPQAGPGTSGGSIVVAETPINAVEFYNTALDHYFVTPWAPDLDAIESGRAPGWAATGQTISVWAAPSKDVPDFNVPVCRFYIPPEKGDSHFFSASADECATVESRFPEFYLETMSAFVVAPVDEAYGDAVCARYPRSGFSTPVYRVWNGRADSNHRYTTDRATRDAMVANGWIAEGEGPDRIAFCASW